MILLFILMTVMANNNVGVWVEGPFKTTEECEAAFNRNYDIIKQYGDVEKIAKVSHVCIPQNEVGVLYQEKPAEIIFSS